MSVSWSTESASYGYHVLEGMAGTANVTWDAPRYGLTSAEPCDKEYGWNLATRDGRKSWLLSVEKGRPLVLIVGFDRRLWCRYNSWVNFRGREDELERLRRGDLIILDTIYRAIETQVKAGRYFLFEQPLESELLKTPKAMKILKLPGVESVVSEMCGLGKMDTTDENPLWKRMKFISKSELLLQAVHGKCPGPDAHPIHTRVHGKETRPSGIYPDMMVQNVPHSPDRFALRC